MMKRTKETNGVGTLASLSSSSSSSSSSSAAAAAALSGSSASYDYYDKGNKGKRKHQKQKQRNIIARFILGPIQCIKYDWMQLSTVSSKIGFVLFYLVLYNTIFINIKLLLDPLDNPIFNCIINTMTSSNNDNQKQNTPTTNNHSTDFVAVLWLASYIRQMSLTVLLYYLYIVYNMGYTFHGTILILIHMMSITNGGLLWWKPLSTNETHPCLEEWFGIPWLLNGFVPCLIFLLFKYNNPIRRRDRFYGFITNVLREMEMDWKQQRSSLFGCIGVLSYYAYLFRSIYVSVFGMISYYTSNTLLLYEDTNTSSSSSTRTCLLSVLRTMEPSNEIGVEWLHSFRQMTSLCTFLFSIQLLLFFGGNDGYNKIYNCISIVIVSFGSFTMTLLIIHDQNCMIQYLSLGNVFFSLCLPFLSLIGSWMGSMTSTTATTTSITTTATTPTTIVATSTAGDWKHVAVPVQQQQQHQQIQQIQQKQPPPPPSQKSTWDSVIEKMIPTYC